MSNYPPIHFPQQPVLGIQRDGQYINLGDYWFEYIKVPNGFIYDGASVPRCAWSIMPPDGLHRAASLIHDFLYTSKPPIYDRKTSDLVFYEIMVKSGVAKWRAKLAYSAVRMFGGGYWRI